MKEFTVALITSIVSSGVISVVLQHYFSKRFESKSLQRTQAAKIANFFAKWTKFKGNEKTILTDKELYDYYEELTSMSYELSLWLKDEKLLKKISARTTLKDKAPRIDELLIEVRKLILNQKETGITEVDIVRWDVK